MTAATTAGATPSAAPRAGPRSFSPIKLLSWRSTSSPASRSATTRAVDWYERLLGAGPSFLPNDVEAVWELAEHRYVYVELLPERAGRAMHSLFVDDLDD